MHVFLLRHGESTSDIEDRYGGDYDDHLTPKGLAEAKELAEKLAGKGIEAIYTSSRVRAKETADVLKDVLKCKIEINSNLRERNAYGVLTGKVKAEAKEKYPEMAEAVKFYGNTIEGAESYENFTERVRRVFEELTSTQHETIAILTHGGPIRCFFREVVKLGELKSLGDCAVFELEKSLSGYKIIKIDGAVEAG
ncbi:MAG: histidine phosphatase family protein [Patescibacteria group bacterium]|jgi:broad specificity phosphatase PhoE